MKSFILQCAPSGSKDLALQLGLYIAKLAAASIDSRSRFVLAVSGGSLPVALASALQAVEEAGIPLSTEKWYILYADERLVEEGHAESNHKGLETNVYSLPFWKAPKENIFQINYALVGDPAQCAVDYESRIRNLCTEGNTKIVSVDLVLLGMGPDGHTASLFPGHPLLNETSLLIAPIIDSPKPPSCRITFTYPLLSWARDVAFVAYGAGKAEMLQRVLAEAEGRDKKSEIENVTLPSARVKPLSGFCTWFVCNDAAKLVGDVM